VQHTLAVFTKQQQTCKITTGRLETS